jgi:hypothetical protein
MVGLLAAPAGIASQVGVDPETVCDPHPFGFLTKGERNVVPSLKKDDVLALIDAVCLGRVAQLLRHHSRPRP